MRYLVTARLVAPVLAYNVAIGVGNLAMTLRIVELGGSVSDVGLAALLYNLFFALTSPIWPVLLAPRIGRRKTVSLGALLTSIAFTLSVPASQPLHIVLLNIVYGLGASMIPPALTVIFIEFIEKPRARVIGFLNQVSGVGWLIGLLIGSYPMIELKDLLFIASAIGLVAAIKSALLLPEPLGILETRKIAVLSLIPWISDRARQLPIILFQYPRLSKLVALLMDVYKSLKIRLSRTLPLLNLGTIVLFTSIGLFFTVIPVYLRSYMGLSDSSVFALNAIAALVSTVAFTYVSRVAEVNDKVWNMLLSAVALRTLLFTAPVTYMAITDMDVVVYASLSTLFALFGITWSMIALSLNTLVISLSEINKRDERLGQLNTMISTGIILGSMLAGLIGKLGYTISFIVSGILAAIALTIYYKAKTTIIA